MEGYTWSEREGSRMLPKYYARRIGSEQEEREQRDKSMKGRERGREWQRAKERKRM